MRVLPLFLLLAACGWRGPSADDGPLEQTRIVYRQYYKANTIFILENLAGRDLVELRSTPLKTGETPVAYIDDDVMREVLKEFERGGFWDYAVPRPRDPRKLGAKAELTIISADRSDMKSFLRVFGKSKKEFDAYDFCKRTFQATWDAFPPQMQATVSAPDQFGVSGKKTGAATEQK